MNPERFLRQAMIVSLAILLTGCVNTTRIMKNASVQLSAVGYLNELREAGKLPGITSEDKGQFSSLPPVLIGERQSVAFHLSKSHEPDIIYWYVLERTNDYALWKLTRAWRTDENGNHKVVLTP